MKLSEAIRLGASVTKPIRCQLMLSRPNGDDYTCALGAAGVAVGMRDVMNNKPDAFDYLIGAFPILADPIRPEHRGLWVKGVPGGREVELRDLIIYLNDQMLWGRGDIADLVELYEQGPDPKEIRQETEALSEALVG